MPGGAYNNAIFEAGGYGKSASGPPIPVELESGCAGWGTPDDSPGRCSMISGCAGYEMPSNNPGGGSMTNTSAVATGLGPGIGPAMGPGVGNPDDLWSLPQVAGLST